MKDHRQEGQIRRQPVKKSALHRAEAKTSDLIQLIRKVL